MTEWLDLDLPCRHADPRIFFPEIATAGHILAADEFCGACPARIECYALALETKPTCGIWGGVAFGCRGKPLRINPSPYERRMFEKAKKGAR